jgi:hypothetical protein
MTRKMLFINIGRGIGENNPSLAGPMSIFGLNSIGKEKKTNHRKRCRKIFNNNLPVFPAFFRIG